MDKVELLRKLNKKTPAEIEAESFSIIESEMPKAVRNLMSKEEWIIARRIIHTTGDLSIVSNVKCSSEAIKSGTKALKKGVEIFCDSNMIKNGLSAAKLNKVNNLYERDSINCYIADKEIAEYAAKNKMTRAASAVDKAGSRLDGSIVLIGNAPSALIKVIEKYYNDGIRPALIIGMPVGFVNVVESKELLAKTDLPYIMVTGRRGGSPLAVATLHALIEIINLGVQLLLMNINRKFLRTGFSTGACVAACARALFMQLKGNSFALKNFEVLFPDGKRRNMVLNNAEHENGNCLVSIIKDAGSDPDITNGILIECELKEIPDKQKILYQDYVLKLDNTEIVIHGKKGVGVVTRDGVVPEKGKWAINPGPVKMISDNLKDIDVGCDSITENKLYLLEITFHDGEELAKKTLNPKLGIIGGLSVLGTTGIVVPYSHDAYVETIRIIVNSIVNAKNEHVVFTTGAQTLRNAREIYPQLREEVFIRIADFITDALKIVSTTAIKKVTIACMPGKLFKYACAFSNTNAKYAEIDTNRALAMALDAGIVYSQSEIDLIKNASTIREIILKINNDKKSQLIQLWKELAEHFLTKKLDNENIEIELLVFDFK